MFCTDRENLTKDVKTAKNVTAPRYFKFMQIAKNTRITDIKKRLLNPIYPVNKLSIKYIIKDSIRKIRFFKNLIDSFYHKSNHIIRYWDWDVTKNLKMSYN